MTDSQQIETIVNEIKSSKKYKFLSTDTIRNVVLRETRKYKSLKNALKSAKKKLHLILADYLSELDFPGAERKLEDVFASQAPDKIEQVCVDIMSRHASTRERLEILHDFYSGIFEITGKPAKLADLACAVNPFSFRWMGLSNDTFYHAFDNNSKTVQLLDFYFQLEHLNAAAEMRDILCEPPDGCFDVALLFKMYHCLEHRQKAAGWEVVKNTPAKWIAVSFPTRTLANRKSDIFGNYKEYLFAQIKENNWDSQVLEFRTELVLLIRKG